MSRRSHLHVLVFAACAVACGASAAAQMATRSPFMPPQGATSSAPAAEAPLEYRGFIETTEGLQFRLYDPVKKAGAWVRIDQRNPDLDVVVRQHSGEHQTLTIEHAGKTITLAERKAKVVSSGNAAQAVPPQPQPATPVVAPAVTQAVVLNPTPADEQRRLEAVAAEVARRRALREQATQQISQGNGPQIAIPQVQPQNSNPGGQRGVRPQTPGNRQQR